MEQRTASVCKFAWEKKMAILGPGLLTVGSSIRPGTVTSSTQVGATYGFQLFWCVIFSVIVVIVVQGMSARLGIITQEGLAENLKNDFTDCPLLRNLLCDLVALAIAIGGFAYMSGDLTGTALGTSALTGISTKITASVRGLCILLILNFAGDAVKYLEKLLGICVIIMAVVFMMTIVIVRPDLGTMLAGCIPSIPENGGLMTYLSLIGTTVVSYNMFLHAASTKRTWHSAEELLSRNFGTTLPMIIDGIVTGSIMATLAAVMHGMTVSNAMDMVIQFELTLGALARPSMVIGPITAGVSSAVCTPMEVSYVLTDLFGWRTDSSDKRYTLTNVVALITGIVIVAPGINLLGLIMAAQAVNGIVFPVVVSVMVYLTCCEKTTGQYKNNMLQTIFGIAIFAISLILSVGSFLGASP